MDPIQGSSQSTSSSWHDDELSPLDGVSGFYDFMGLQAAEGHFNTLVRSSLDMVPPLPQTSRWEICAGANEITVNGCEFTLVEDPVQCGKAFFFFLEALCILKTFTFQAFGGIADPNVFYEKRDSAPRAVDIIPLLECHRSLIERGGDTTGFELLLNWVIEKHIPRETIPFTLFDFQGKPMGKMDLHLHELMEIYGFGLKARGVLNLHSSEQPPLVFYPLEQQEPTLVAVQDLDGNCHKIRFSPNGVPQIKSQFVEDLELRARPQFSLGRLESLLIHYEETEDRNILNQVAEQVMMAETVLATSPPEEIEALFNLVAMASEILQANGLNLSSQFTEQEVEGPALSPKSRERELRRREKEEID